MRTGLSSQNILLTGSTGLLGSRLLSILLEKTSFKITLFVRYRNTKSYKQKINRIYEKCKHINCNRIKIVNGDLENKDLGLSIKNKKYLINNITKVYHCAALTSFTMNYRALLKINYSGTVNLLKFLRNVPNCTSFEYISTIFVAGDYTGAFSEKDLNLGQNFNNFYEKSKWDVENFLAKYSDNKNLNVRIYRPGVIIGDFPSGKIINPGLLYKLFRLLYFKTLDFIPIENDARLNLIPANIAAMMIYSASLNEFERRTLHILMPDDINVKSVVTQICEILHVKKPNFISMVDLRKMMISPATSKFLAPLLPYLNFKAKIKSDLSMESFKNLNIEFPKLNKKFFRNLLDSYLNKKSIVDNGV